MTKIEEEIEKINSFVKKFMWMDFSYEYITEYEIKIIGTTDLSYEECNEIEIYFTNVSNILSTLFDWTKDDDKPLIELISKEEILKKMDYIGEKRYCFRMNADGYSDGPIWIVAESIKCKILKE